MRIFSSLLVSIFLAASLYSVSAYSQEGGSAVEPKITIRHEEDKTFYEYRVNGVLKEIKVEPKVGPVYYLVPADGEGWIREEKSQLLVPKWVIFLLIGEFNLCLSLLPRAESPAA